MASTFFHRTMDRTTDSGYTKKWIFSAWIKISSLGEIANKGLFSIQKGSTSNSRVNVGFDSSDKLWVETKDSTGNDDAFKATDMVFRDTNAWYHIYIKYDSTESTASDRLIIVVNGEAQTYNNVNEVSSNFGILMDSNVDWRLGIYRTNGGAIRYFDGIMSHVHFSEFNDSDTPTPYTAFGSTDSTTGEWKINTAPSVTYGSQGLFVLKDNNLGTDQSGQSNNLSASGTCTKTEDCPSNVFCTINPLSNKINFSLANGNTTLNDNGSDDNDNGIAATMGVNSGKYYWEMKKGSGSGGVHAVITDDVDVRLGNRATSSPDSNLWGFQSNGTGAPLVSYIAGTFDSSGNALQGWGANDIIGFALDMDNGKLYVSINGTFKGLNNNTSDPANATNPAITGIPTGGKFIIPYFEKRSADSPETMCNFGNGYFGTTAVSSNSGNGYSASGSLGVFQYQPPSGYTALCTKGLNE